MNLPGESDLALRTGPANVVLVLTGIVLAAGLSRRAAPLNKLLLPVIGNAGRTVVRATTEALCEAGLDEVVVVTGNQRTEIERALAGLPLRFVFASEFAAGVGHSLAAGVGASSRNAIGFAITPGDLPDLTASLVRRVVEVFAESRGARHVIPTAGGVRGHPVVIGAWLRPQLEQLTGDVGARHLLAAPAERARCRMLELDDPAITRDVDRG